MRVQECPICEKKFETKLSKYCSKDCKHQAKLISARKYSAKFKKTIVLDDENEWKEIEGFEKLYFINKNGDVKGKNGVLQSSIGKNGYHYIALCKDSKHYTKNIHRLLAEAFLPNPDNKPFVDHIDRNRLNNKLDNLRWATVQENINNSERVEFKKGCICETKDKVKDKIYTYFRVYYFENNVKKTKRFKTMEEAEAFHQRYLPQ
jgi:hypothetical protein